MAQNDYTIPIISNASLRKQKYHILMCHSLKMRLLLIEFYFHMQ